MVLEHNYKRLGIIFTNKLFKLADINNTIEI